MRALALMLVLIVAMPSYAANAPAAAPVPTPAPAVEQAQAATSAAGGSVAAQARSARPVEFRSDAEAARFRALVAELRCVMCQNQSLADSDAMIAHDLRREILAMMREGRSDAQIKEFLVARYSDFVLYRPAFGPRNWLLWLGPGLLLLVGGLVVWRIVRTQRARAAAAAAAAGGPAPAATLGDDGEEW
jgi:cytochrome c-type biogenesis protein CcmH